MGAEAMGRRSDGTPKRWGASPRRRNVPRAEPLSEGESTARGDAVALAGALGGPARRPCSTALLSGPARRAAPGERGRAVVTSKFARAQMAERVEQALDEVLDSCQP